MTKSDALSTLDVAARDKKGGREVMYLSSVSARDGGHAQTQDPYRVRASPLGGGDMLLPPCSAGAGLCSVQASSQ